MPSTRGGGRHDLLEGLEDSDDEYDPDYDEEESASEDDLPQTFYRDRAHWIEDNLQDIEFLYRHFLEEGRSIMGATFFQTGNVTQFAQFLYRYTTPLSE
jgi:hypothetical protein